jgi:hypothetical protein
MVDFPGYCGPPWIADNPTWIPIPPCEITCASHCCTFKFIPLSLAHAKTGHNIQGNTVGPGYAIPCIIVQPGSLAMEHICPGLLYMFLSRRTTIGSEEDRSSSAIFFFTSKLTNERIQTLTRTNDGKIEEKIKRRHKWTGFLRRNRVHTDITEDEKTVSSNGQKKWKYPSQQQTK